MAKTAKKVPVALLNLIKLEFEANRDIDTILDKYKITREQLGEPEWLTAPQPQPTVQQVEVLPAVVSLPAPQQEIVQDDSVIKILEKISSFKEKAVDYALELMTSNMIGDTKELKDLISSVTAIEATYKDQRPKDNTPVINIAIQNLVDRFRDDC